MKMDQTEKLILEAIDQHRDEIIEFARDIYDHGELGYKEFNTAEKFIKKMKELGLRTETGLAITGTKAYLNEEKKDTASLALLGELDALRIPEHAHANPETDAAHCCGHHAQMAGVFGAALALTVPEIAEKLDGQVVFFATPAEEDGEIEFKNQLREQGKIRYGGGKCELLRIGAFDDIDLCLTHHIRPGNEILVGSGTGNGFVSKVIRVLGKASHAAGAPEKGVNALSAASLGLQALGLNRETFRDEDCVRVHPIITKGGNLVNVIPDEVVVETLVRGKTIEAFTDAAKKTDRSFKAGAVAMGAKVEISTLPGYLPTLAEEALPELKPVFAAIHTQYPDIDKTNVGVGSTIFAVKPGDGSAREQAASCQKVLGGWANIANEYATKRYRSNLINWGMLPFLIPERDLPFTNGDYIFVPEIRKAVEEKADVIKAYVVKDGALVPFEMTLGALTDDEREIIRKGCLINYYRG